MSAAVSLAPAAPGIDQSIAEWLATLPANDRARLLAELAPTLEDQAALEYSWTFWRRPKQSAPAWEWQTWLNLAGRGFGKTRTGAEWVREEVEAAQGAGEPLRIALVARTAGDVRDVMVEGESGILAVSPPWNRPHYEPSKRRLTWRGGIVATTYTADKPDQLRGPQHHRAWADELAAWRYPEAWDQLELGLRLGDRPRSCVTTTPRPTQIIRDLLARAQGPRRSVALTRGSTYENRANLAATFLAKLLAKYEGTRLGRQELHADVLDDVPGALWTRDRLEGLRSKLDPATLLPKIPECRRIVVAVDPAVTAGEESSETGIIVAGVDEQGFGHVLEDLSGKHSPDAWAHIAVGAYETWHADKIVAEVNNGGDLVERNVRTVDKRVPYQGVRASKGKYTRAEPVAALYEQRRVRHVGTFAELEDQMCTWVPGEKSPDRLDALVWAITALMLGEMLVPARGMGQQGIGVF
jgi:phage terminase large subunit-like protein